GNITSSDSLKRTVIMIHKNTIAGQQMFIRGGITLMQRSGCGSPAESDPCAIHIAVHPLEGNNFKAYEAWGHGDTRFGPNYWLVDMDMDCTQTDNGWFNVRALVTPRINAEHRIYQKRTCHGNVLDLCPFKSFHHVAKCGYFNLFKYNDGNCLIKFL
ncbi:unnamed protein product, partial [Meganyctiphanes norvegica]